MKEMELLEDIVSRDEYEYYVFNYLYDEFYKVDF